MHQTASSRTSPSNERVEKVTFLLWLAYIRNKNISQYRTGKGMGGLRERNYVCDHGSNVLVRCPEGARLQQLWK